MWMCVHIYMCILVCSFMHIFSWSLYTLYVCVCMYFSATYVHVWVKFCFFHRIYNWFPCIKEYASGEIEKKEWKFHDSSKIRFDSPHFPSPDMVSLKGFNPIVGRHCLWVKVFGFYTSFSMLFFGSGKGQKERNIIFNGIKNGRIPINGLASKDFK